MLSWILIPTYLFKNSLHRWFENLASPATKLLIPFLLSLFGMAIFGFLRGLEVQLKEQLDRSELRTIRTFEAVFGPEAPQRLAELAGDERLWSGYCERYESFQQVPLLGQVSYLEQVPIIAYDKPISFVEMPPSVPGQPEEVFLLANGSGWSPRVDIALKGYSISARLLPLPEVLAEYYQKPAVILVPRSIAEPIMVEGFTHVQVLVPRKDVSVGRLQELVRGQARLESRQVRLDSSLATLSRLEELLAGQRLVRLALGVGLALILSLILGALALLEFRHEAYILALLRSFGVRGFVLAIHFFLENLFLTLVGIGLGLVVYTKTAGLLLVRISDQLASGVAAPSLSAIPSRGDVHILVAAAGVGVVLAVLPVLWGLRKRPGLILS